MATGFSIRYKSRGGSRDPSNWSGHKKSWEFSPGSRGHLACKRLFRPQALECSTRAWQRKGKVEGAKCLTIKSFTFIIFSWLKWVIKYLNKTVGPVPYNLTGQGFVLNSSLLSRIIDDTEMTVFMSFLYFWYWWQRTATDNS